jgi:hypothetical protein
MNKRTKILFKLAAGLILFSACNSEKKENGAEEVIENKTQVQDTVRKNIIEIPNEFVVIFRPDSLKEFKNKFLSIQRSGTLKLKWDSYGDLINKTFNYLDFNADSLIDITKYALVIKADMDEINNLLLDARVLRVERSYQVYVDIPDAIAENVDVEEPQWGLIRTVNTVLENKNYVRTAWILDTGVDPDHTELNVDKDRSKSFYPGKEYFEVSGSKNGHGTHVAGIIGAKRNGIGVIGVTPNVQIVAVKFIHDGSYFEPKYHEALRYILEMAKKGDVLNLSIQRTRGSETEIELIKKIADKGIKVVIAAGNDSLDVDRTSTSGYPAKINYTNVFTISSFKKGDSCSGFSNFGLSVDFSAPGQDIRSTMPGGGYGKMSGTSMSAPYVSGLFLRYPTIRNLGSIDFPKEGRTHPVAHE